MPFTGKGSFPLSSKALREDRNPVISVEPTNTSDRVPACHHPASIVARTHTIISRASAMDPALKDVIACEKGFDQEDNSDSTAGTVEESYGRTSVIDVWRRRERDTLERKKVNEMVSPPRAKRIIQKSPEEIVNQKLNSESKETQDATSNILTPNQSFVASGDVIAVKGSSPVKRSFSDTSAGTALQTVEASFDDGVVAFDKNYSPFSSPSFSLRKTGSPYPDLLLRRNHSGISRLEIPPSGSSKEVAEHQEEAAARIQLALSPSTLKKNNAQKRRENVMNVWAQREKAPASPSFITRKSPASVTANFFDIQGQGTPEGSTTSRDSNDNLEATTTSIQVESVSSKSARSPDRRSLSVLDRWKQGMVHTDDFSSSQENSPLSRTRSNKMRQLVKDEESTGDTVSYTSESPTREKDGSMSVLSPESPEAKSPARSVLHKEAPVHTQMNCEDLPFDEENVLLSGHEIPGVASNIQSTPKREECSKKTAIPHLPGYDHKVVAYSPLARKSLDTRFASVSASSLNSGEVKGKEEHCHAALETLVDSSDKEENLDGISAEVCEDKSGPGPMALKESHKKGHWQKKSGSVLDRWSHHVQKEQQTPPSVSIGADKAKKNTPILEGSKALFSQGSDTSPGDDEFAQDFSRKLCVAENQRNGGQLKETNKSGFGSNSMVTAAFPMKNTRMSKAAALEEDCLRLDYTQGSVLSSRSDLSAPLAETPKRIKNHDSVQKCEKKVRNSPAIPADYAAENAWRAAQSLSSSAIALGDQGTVKHNLCTNKTTLLSKAISTERKIAPLLPSKETIASKSPKRKLHDVEDTKPVSRLLRQYQKEVEETAPSQEAKVLEKVNSGLSNFPTNESRQSSYDSEVPRSESRQSYFIKKGKLRAQRRRMQRMSPSSDRQPLLAPSQRGGHHSEDTGEPIDDQTEFSSYGVSGEFLQRSAQLKPKLPASSEPNSKRARGSAGAVSQKVSETGISEAHQSDTISFFSHAGSAFCSVTSPSTRVCAVNKEREEANAPEISKSVLDAQEIEPTPEIPVAHSSASPIVSSSESFPMDETQWTRTMDENPSFQVDETPRLARRYRTSSRFLHTDVQQSCSYAADNSTVDSAQNSSQATSVSSNYSYDSGGSESGFFTAVEESYKRRRRRRKKGTSKSAVLFSEELSRAFQSAYLSFGFKKFSEDFSETVKALDLAQLTSELNEGMHVASESLRRLVVDRATTSTNEPGVFSPAANSADAQQGAKGGSVPTNEGVAIEVEYISDSDEDSQADILCSNNTGGEGELVLTPDPSDIFSIGDTTANSLVFLGQVKLGSSMQSGSRYS